MILQDNLLASLPVSMLCLSRLHTLDISRNKMTGDGDGDNDGKRLCLVLRLQLEVGGCGKGSL
jgi:hypothetical protein